MSETFSTRVAYALYEMSHNWPKADIITTFIVSLIPCPSVKWTINNSPYGRLADPLLLGKLFDEPIAKSVPVN